MILNGKKKKNKILYGIVLDNDIKILEERILNYSTSVINQFERYIKIKNL